MTTSQNIRIYELLRVECPPEDARQLTEAIEAVIDEKVTEGNKNYEVLLNKDLQIFRKEMDVKFSEVKSDMKEQKFDMIKWFVSLFFALELMILVLYLKK